MQSLFLHLIVFDQASTISDEEQMKSLPSKFWDRIKTVLFSSEYQTVMLTQKIFTVNSEVNYFFLLIFI